MTDSFNDPSSDPRSADIASLLLDKTLADLEWQRVEGAVSAHLRGPGASTFRLPLASTRAAAMLALDETVEALVPLRAAEPLPLDGIRDVGDHLLRVERHGDLDAP